MPLRPYQLSALEASKTKLNEGINRQLLKLPTGMGKAVILAAKPEYMGFKNRSLIGVHREELVNQLANTMKEWNPGRSVGVEMADRFSNNEDIIVASIPTIGRLNSERLLKFKKEDFDSIDIDEAHHATGDSYQRVINHFDLKNNIKRLGLGVTATPNRTDKVGLGDTFQEIIFDYNLLQGIREGWLSDLKCVRVRTESDLDKVATQLGDFNLGQLTEAIDTPERNDLVARSWLKHGENRQTVVFASDIMHSQNLAIAFKRYGIVCEAIWGSDEDRQSKLEGHRAGQIKVLVNCQILTEGYDDWRIGCIVLARPTKSETLYTQIIGRGTRIPKGIDNLIDARSKNLVIEKEDCIIIDVVDVTSKHSLISLPSLFGLNRNMDMKGKKVTSVMKEVEDITKSKPFFDLYKVEDADKIKSYSEEINLFKVTFSPEVVQYSEYQWHKIGEDKYILKLQGGSEMIISHDLLDKWHAVGQINNNEIKIIAESFSDCIKAADINVRKYGGNGLVTTAKRNPTWGNDVPTPVQLATLAKFKIPIPNGITKGEAALRLSKLFLELDLKREARAAAIKLKNKII